MRRPALAALVTRAALVGVMGPVGLGCRRAPREALDLPAAPAAPAASATASLPAAGTPVSRGDLCVTNGTVAPGAAPWRMRSATLRAVLAPGPAGSGNALALRFRYVGPTAETVPLASGEIRHQVGVKLRALDTCNVVYAMWHLDTGGPLRVSVKRNPGMSRHEACRDHGYVSVVATFARTLPIVTPGQSHSLAATIEGTELVVLADGERAWQGALPAEAFAIDGPAGIRSDHTQLEIELFEPRSAARGRCPW